MTQQTNIEEQRSDHEILRIVAEAIQIFNDFAPSERKKIRSKFRRHYACEDGLIMRNHGKPRFDLEAKYDNLDFAGG
jgi:hypothetical protein